VGCGEQVSGFPRRRVGPFCLVADMPSVAGIHNSGTLDLTNNTFSNNAGGCIGSAGSPGSPDGTDGIGGNAGGAIHLAPTSSTTTPNPTSVTLPSSAPLKDSAMLSGGISPTGSITFTLHPTGRRTADERHPCGQLSVGRFLLRRQKAASRPGRCRVLVAIRH
jgi:hypothetical protein